jgi:hypothetical protein
MKRVLPIAKFPHKFFAVVAIFALVAFIFSLKPVAQVLKKGADMAGIKFPPVEVFQAAAADMVDFAAGIMLFLIGLSALVIGVKAALIIAGASIAFYAGYKIYSYFFGSSNAGTDLPGGTIDTGN